MLPDTTALAKQGNKDGCLEMTGDQEWKFTSHRKRIRRKFNKKLHAAIKTENWLRSYAIDDVLSQDIYFYPVML